MLNLQNNHFKSAILNMVEEFKETVSEEQKASMRKISYQIEDINKNIEIIKTNQIKNSGVKSTIIEIEKFTREYKQQIWEGSISEFENRSVEIIQFKEAGKKKKNKGKWTEPQRPLWQHQTHPHTKNGRSWRGKESEGLFEEILDENFPNLIKNINLPI